MQPPTGHTKDTYMTEFYNADRSFQFMEARLHEMNVYSSNSKYHQRNLQNRIYKPGHHKNGYLCEK